VIPPPGGSPSPSSEGGADPAETLRQA
jgi:hypothetical protein